jgi:predicted RNA-binding Zn ribbon-like protein
MMVITSSRGKSMKLETSSPGEHAFVGGELCLDFANTADWHASDAPQERLKNYKDLVDWGAKMGILDDASAKRLLRRAAIHPSRARAALTRAIALRESMYRIFVGIVSGREPDRADLEAFNIALSKALRHLRVARVADRFAWDWEDDDGALDSLLWPVLRSAADVLTSDKRMRVGQCADDRGCGWLFLDWSKNRSRRWCEMADCGNRAKAQRHYERVRRSRSTAKR